MALGSALAGLVANGAGLTTLPAQRGAQQTTAWLFAIFAIAPLLAAGLIRQQPRSTGEAS
jgi:hypothetical protein